MNQIIITKGSGGYGGPLVIKPTDKKNKVMYITGGNEPAILKRIVELTGLIPVNGFKTKVPDEEIAVAIVDWRCCALWCLSAKRHSNCEY